MVDHKKLILKNEQFLYEDYSLSCIINQIIRLTEEICDTVILHLRKGLLVYSQQHVIESNSLKFTITTSYCLKKPNVSCDAQNLKTYSFESTVCDGYQWVQQPFVSYDSILKDFFSRFFCLSIKLDTKFAINERRTINQLFELFVEKKAALIINAAAVCLKSIPQLSPLFSKAFILVLGDQASTKVYKIDENGSFLIFSSFSTDLKKFKSLIPYLYDNEKQMFEKFVSVKNKLLLNVDSVLDVECNFFGFDIFYRCALTTFNYWGIDDFIERRRLQSRDLTEPYYYPLCKYLVNQAQDNLKTMIHSTYVSLHYLNTLLHLVSANDDCLNRILFFVSTFYFGIITETTIKESLRKLCFSKDSYYFDSPLYLAYLARKNYSKRSLLSVLYLPHIVAIHFGLELAEPLVVNGKLNSIVDLDWINANESLKMYLIHSLDEIQDIDESTLVQLVRSRFYFAQNLLRNLSIDGTNWLFTVAASSSSSGNSPIVNKCHILSSQEYKSYTSYILDIAKYQRLIDIPLLIVASNASKLLYKVFTCSEKIKTDRQQNSNKIYTMHEVFNKLVTLFVTETDIQISTELHNAQRTSCVQQNQSSSYNNNGLCLLNRKLYFNKPDRKDNTLDINDIGFIASCTKNSLFNNKYEFIITQDSLEIVNFLNDQ